jgi:hypothetical protein
MLDEIQPPMDPDVAVSAAAELDLSTEPNSSVASQSPARRFDLHLYFGLLAASFLGTLAIIPYSMTLMKQLELAEALLPILMAVTVVVELLVSMVAIGLGLWLGPQVGLARLVVRDDFSAVAASDFDRIWALWGKPLFIGVALGALMAFYAWGVNFSGGENHRPLSTPSPWEGLLASVGAGVREEIWLRLGLMTFLVWFGVRFVGRFTRPAKSRPQVTIVWIANLLAALGFAAIHIPQAKALLGLSAPLMLFIFVGNGVPGLVFGWLYWRRGLLAAMLAHFGLDLVLKVLIPLVS